MKLDNFTYEIKQKIATISTNGDITKELNLISYNNAPARYDLRSWKHSDGKATMHKGITFSEEELFFLKEALNNLEELKNYEATDYSKDDYGDTSTTAFTIGQF